MKNEIDRMLEEIYPNKVTATDYAPISGGCINNAEVLSLSNGEKIFIKYHPNPPRDFFKKEAYGLNLLRQTRNGPCVPKPLCSSNPGYLLMEYIPQESPQRDYHERFGRMLAEMHRETDTHYGLNHDNYIGKTAQRNTKENDPIVFFREHRIRFQQVLAREQRLLPTDLDRQLDVLCNKLGNLLDVTNEKPALNHGDLWSGNHFCGPKQKPYIVDPAAHFNLREADLAMMELFGSLPQGFYQAYNEVFPLNPLYKQRRNLYNLYHLLNHLNLFGESYLNSIKNIVSSYVK